MAASRQEDSVSDRVTTSGASQGQMAGRCGIKTGEAGQALLEFAGAIVMLLILVFGIIDFSRAIYDKQVMAQLSREGSDLVSRSSIATGPSVTSSLSAAASTVAGEASSSLNFTTNGKIIISMVQNIGTTGSPNCVLQGQGSNGGLVATSKIGTTIGAAATLSTCSGATPLPPPGQTVWATEVFYSYTSITPLGKLVKVAFPGTLYDVAVF
jgi:Flp pilus assembly protein TadG